VADVAGGRALLESSTATDDGLIGSDTVLRKAR
jgi:hypothetical protein